MSRTANHSPGPWERSSGGIWVISPWNARVRIATMTQISPMNGIDQEANGCLIATAPELLEMCRAFSDPGTQITARTIEDARAVVAKATGTS